MTNFTEIYAPWLGDRERQEIFDEILRHPPQSFSADELASRLGLKDVDRTVLGIRTIGATDCNKEQREARRKQKNRERERQRRAISARTRPIAFRSRIEMDKATLKRFLPDVGRRMISDIAGRAIKMRDPISIKSNGRPLDREAVRRKLNRLADRLGELLEEDIVPGPNGFPMRRIWWRRTLDTGK